MFSKEFKIYNIIILLALSLLIGSNVETNAQTAQSNWSDWNKYNDCPGIKYRTSCSGKLFTGSKFNKWQIEIANNYGNQVDAEVMILDDFGLNVSEVQKVKLLSGSSKRISFNIVKMPCSEDYNLKILAQIQ